MLLDVEEYQFRLVDYLNDELRFEKRVVRWCAFAAGVLVGIVASWIFNL
jgi:hypothetical protein